MVGCVGQGGYPHCTECFVRCSLHFCAPHVCLYPIYVGKYLLASQTVPPARTVGRQYPISPFPSLPPSETRILRRSYPTKSPTNVEHPLSWPQDPRKRGD